MGWIASTAPRVTSIDREYYDEVVEGCVPLLPVVRVVQPAVWSGQFCRVWEACGKPVRHKIAVKTIRCSWDSLR